jgi:hypothetical protein
MTIKEKILLDLKEITSPGMLYQILDFLTLLKRNSVENKSNLSKVLAFAGILSAREAEEIKTDIAATFNHIEGEW